MVWILSLGVAFLGGFRRLVFYGSFGFGCLAGSLRWVLRDCLEVLVLVVWVGCL